MQRVRHPPTGSAALAGAVLILLVTGCATGPDNVVVNVAPYVAQASAAAASKAAVRVETTKDARREATGAMVGERTGLGNMSMGSVSINPAPSALVTSVIKSELAAMGFDAGSTGDGPAVSTQLVKFQIVTPATMLYWDINGTIELDLAANRPDGKKHATRYAVQCTARTYSWPGEEVIGAAIASCLKELGGKIKGDTALASLLTGR